MPPRLCDVFSWCRLALRAILPVDCLSCAQPLALDTSAYLCRACWDSITPFAGPRCAQCGQPFVSRTADWWLPGHRCQPCLNRPPAYDRAWTLYPYMPPLQDGICALKYRNVYGLAAPLAALMIRALPQEIDADVLVPVPLHPSRLRTREFNQSLLIADRLGRHMNRPVSSIDLIRVAATEPQTSLTRPQRLRNLRRAFVVGNAEPFVGRRVLLIDDVFTTGTTLNECAKTLRTAGAASVWALTLARTIDSSLVPDRMVAARAPFAHIGR
ncbi:MAG TPA: ComF family protein [Nitrospira sp.]|nr:ComF family protein [Nitrospira sp.]